MKQSDTWNIYCGSAPVPSEIVVRWNGDPWLLSVLLLAAVGWVAALRSRGKSRHDWALPFFSLAVALVLFVSPLCALTSALFSARSLHHIVLTGILALLLAADIGRPRVVEAAWAAFGSALLFAAVLWIWHAPRMYEWTFSSDFAYWLMQISLLASSVFLWRVALSAPLYVGVPSLLLTMTQMGLLGALLSFAPLPLYVPHLATTAPWGLTPLEDQQLGGLLMWIGGGAVYLAAALILLGRTIAPRAVRA